jgi:hypothetical protein
MFVAEHDVRILHHSCLQIVTIKQSSIVELASGIVLPTQILAPPALSQPHTNNHHIIMPQTRFASHLSSNLLLRPSSHHLPNFVEHELHDEILSRRRTYPRGGGIELG